MGRMEKLKGYLSDVAVELKKTSFPTRDQTIGSSVVVVVMVVFMSFFLALADLVLAKVVGLILR
jgi:preprotein translocase subunit SecE|uniref:Protein translocase subunit SecE n=1 Tax=Leptospirillum ferrodiazotrophum TaxID=412449 RepID=C6HVV7_9BACT|nr:MAG: preprotein translocase, SecE subunit [Leptospirillum ferrodiazotrophum]